MQNVTSVGAVKYAEDRKRSLGMERVIVFELTKVDQRVPHLLFLVGRHRMPRVYDSPAVL